MSTLDDSLAQATNRLSVAEDSYSDARSSKSPGKMEFAKPTSTILGDMRLWDITEKFKKLASVLPVGKLVKDENFTLFESVGALEIMDPKMDSGCLAPGEALVDEYNIDRSLLPEEVIGIVDQFLCCEMAWHEGYPLAQTLFSSHYIDTILSLEAKTISQIHFSQAGKENPWNDPLLHLVLRAHCIAVVKCCDYALEEINRSLDGGGTRCNFYEEEDFSGHTYGRQLFTMIPLHPILDLLSSAAEFVDAEKAESIKGNRQSPPEVYEALRIRLDFRIVLTRAMAAEEDIEDKIGFWQDIPKAFDEIKRTHSLGRPIPESFSPKIQRRLASTVPPKPMVELSFEDAFAKLERMCRDCQEAVKIVNFGPDNVQQLKAFLWHFSARQPEPSAYPRACLSAPLFMCDDAGFEQLLRRDLEMLVVPDDEIMDPSNWTVEAPIAGKGIPHPKYEMAKTMNQFTETAVRMPGGYVDFFRALTSNRCRLRRNLVHVAAAWEDLQTRETEELDKTLNKHSSDTLQFPLSTWTYHQKLRTMEWIVQLGFELDMYLPDELAGMYWYLSLLTSSRLSILELILRHISSRPSSSQADRPISSSIPTLSSCIQLLNSLKLECQGTTALATALFTFYTYLSYLALVPDPAQKSPFHDPRLRYELRMKPLLTIKSPELPSFEEWEEVLHPLGAFSSDIGENTAFLEARQTYLGKIDAEVRKAKMNFAELKRLGAVAAGCEGVEEAWTKNISALLQSCIMAGIALSTLKGATDQTKLKLEIPALDKARYHDWWVVPKFTKTE